MKKKIYFTIALIIIILLILAKCQSSATKTDKITASTTIDNTDLEKTIDLKENEDLSLNKDLNKNKEQENQVVAAGLLKDSNGDSNQDSNLQENLSNSEAQNAILPTKEINKKNIKKGKKKQRKIKANSKSKKLHTKKLASKTLGNGIVEVKQNLNNSSVENILNSQYVSQVQENEDSKWSKFFKIDEHKKRNFYVGIDVLRSNTKHRFINRTPNNTDNANGTKQSAISAGYGLRVGYKYKIPQNKKIYLDAEVFLEKFDDNCSISSANQSPTVYNATLNSVCIDKRYGPKIRAGYYLTDKLSVFGDGGISITQRTDRQPLKNFGANKMTKRKPTFVVGFGASYDINKAISLNATYDFQESEFTYYSYAPQTIDKSNMKTVKVGLSYNF